jgi:5-methylthioadenosine/S-adenosylhomocysteine deaminase
VHLDNAEIDLLAKQGASVVHCPSSNLKLASGFAPVHSLLKKGVNVALGTDGAASNNRLDMFQEMRTAALLAKAVSDDPQAMPAHTALRAATLSGAKALGLEKITGSIEPGKAADLIAVDFSAPELSPCYDVVSHLVYVAGRENVSHVWVGGRSLMHEREIENPALERLESRWQLWQNAVRKHADS